MSSSTGALDFVLKSLPKPLAVPGAMEQFASSIEACDDLVTGTWKRMRGGHGVESSPKQQGRHQQKTNPKIPQYRTQGLLRAKPPLAGA